MEFVNMWVIKFIAWLVLMAIGCWFVIAVMGTGISIFFLLLYGLLAGIAVFRAKG